MTDEQYVRRVAEWFERSVVARVSFGMWVVRASRPNGFTILGEGKTEAEAWANAAKRLREGK